MKLDQKLALKIGNLFPAKRREKFLWSVEQIQASLKNEGWLEGVSRSARTAPNKGLINTYIQFRQWEDWHSPTVKQARALSWALNSGRLDKDLKKDLKSLAVGWDHIQTRTQNSDKLSKSKITVKDIKDWITFLDQFHSAVHFLDELRPKTIYTKILLSPKVTKTLKEMNLDIDLQSIKVPEMKEVIGHYLDKQGQKKTYTYHVPIWRKGTKHGMSRFSEFSYQCQACGKTIPSGRFVPVEAHDKKNDQLISLWLGLDCARNIFGVKDIGIDKVPTPPKKS